METFSSIIFLVISFFFFLFFFGIQSCHIFAFIPCPLFSHRPIVLSFSLCVFVLFVVSLYQNVALHLVAGEQRRAAGGEGDREPAVLKVERGKPAAEKPIKRSCRGLSGMHVLFSLSCVTVLDVLCWSVLWPPHTLNVCTSFKPCGMYRFILYPHKHDDHNHMNPDHYSLFLHIATT